LAAPIAIRYRAGGAAATGQSGELSAALRYLKALNFPAGDADADRYSLILTRCTPGRCASEITDRHR